MSKFESWTLRLAKSRQLSDDKLRYACDTNKKETEEIIPTSTNKWAVITSSDSGIWVDSR